MESVIVNKDKNQILCKDRQPDNPRECIVFDSKYGEVKASYFNDRWEDIHGSRELRDVIYWREK